MTDRQLRITLATPKAATLAPIVRETEIALCACPWWPIAFVHIHVVDSTRRLVASTNTSTSVPLPPPHLLGADQAICRSVMDASWVSALPLLGGPVAGPGQRFRCPGACHCLLTTSVQYYMLRIRILTVDKTTGAYHITESSEYREAVCFLPFTYAQGAHRKYTLFRRDDLTLSFPPNLGLPQPRSRHRQLEQSNHE